MDAGIQTVSIVDSIHVGSQTIPVSVSSIDAHSQTCEQLISVNAAEDSSKEAGSQTNASTETGSQTAENNSTDTGSQTVAISANAGSQTMLCSAHTGSQTVLTSTNTGSQTMLTAADTGGQTVLCSTDADHQADLASADVYRQTVFTSANAGSQTSINVAHAGSQTELGSADASSQTTATKTSRQPANELGSADAICQTDQVSSKDVNSQAAEIESQAFMEGGLGSLNPTAPLERCGDKLVETTNAHSQTVKYSSATAENSSQTDKQDHQTEINTQTEHGLGDTVEMSTQTTDMRVFLHLVPQESEWYSEACELMDNDCGSRWKLE